METSSLSTAPLSRTAVLRYWLTLLSHRSNILPIPQESILSLVTFSMLIKIFQMALGQELR